MINKNNSKIRLIIEMLFLIVLLASCSSDDKNITPQETSYDEMYNNSIIDAMIADEDEISHDLIKIVESNDYLKWIGSGIDKKVLVVTWTKYPDSYLVGDTVTTSWGGIWVTIVPEITDKLKKENISGNNIEMRFRQLLGLPPTMDYTHFVQLWVSPEDLYRPSPDNEITDSEASLKFPDNTEEWYIKWFNETIISSYYPASFPWTRLGYTYDWAESTDEIGLSEFVIKKDSKVIVKSNVKTLDYIIE